jgi:acetyl esterase/lipase
MKFLSGVLLAALSIVTTACGTMHAPTRIDAGPVAIAAVAPTSTTLPLWPAGTRLPGAAEDFQPTLETYLWPVDAGTSRGAVIVFPGGGYHHRSTREAGPVAQKFNEAGLQAFVLQYHVTPSQHPAPLLDARRAIRLVRANCEAWGVDPNRIAVCGFSAGGHLAASSGVHYALNIENDPDDLAALVSARPDALILSYAVITSGEFRHAGSIRLLLGENPSEAMLDLVSLEKQVTADTPPTFLWHTSDDRSVPVENSLLFAETLARVDVPFEMHVFPRGRHGLALAPNDPHPAIWIDLACRWLKSIGWMEHRSP